MNHYRDMQSELPALGEIVYEPIGFDGIGGLEFVECKVTEILPDAIVIDEHKTEQWVLKDFMTQKIRKLESWYVR